MQMLKRKIFFKIKNIFSYETCIFPTYRSYEEKANKTKIPCFYKNKLK